ncbi:MAG: MerR family transcriptional regulator [Pedobacter sp.]|jgi:DNA-binding transcriptional MerR regulator
MNLFSISQLSQFSGIKAHTIRIWEQRYNALNPQRSEGNTRYYNDRQLCRLLNIVSMMKSGYKVSSLGVLTDEELFKLVRNSSFESHNDNEYFISQLISAGINYDDNYFNDIFSQSLANSGLKGTYINVILPLLNRLGLMWSANLLSPANEHFISNIIRQKLLAAIDSIRLPDSESKRWLLFLPENEFHEIALLFAHFIIRINGGKVIYLGSDVPIASVMSAIEDVKPDNLLMFLIHLDSTDLIQGQINVINAYFNGQKFYVAGHHNLISNLKLSDKTEYLQSISSLENILSINSRFTANTN